MKLLLRNNQAPGDVLVLTAAVRDLHRAHPGRFITAVETRFPELWQSNPSIVTRDVLGTPDQIIRCEYPLIHESNRRPFHFLHGFVQDLERKLGVAIPVTEFRPDVHFSEAERNSPSPVVSAGHDGPYWVIVAGGKRDFTAKWWSPDSWQAVVDHFAGRVCFVQCGQAPDHHPPLRGVVNLVGKTSLREFLRVIYHAEGVVCPVTFAMHVAAAVPPPPGETRLKPCVVVAGGREPPHWEAYPGHQFLHTIGALDCCAAGGCWRSRCQPLDDGDVNDRSLCEQPVRVSGNLHIGRCMTLITPQKVIEAIELYENPGPRIQAKRVEVKPNGVAVTIGVGPFKELAELAAREMQAMTGLDTVVLDDAHFARSGLEHPAFLKFRLFDLVDAENILYFDADIVCLERWDPRNFFGGPEVIAVRDRMVPSILDEASRWGLPPEDYFNSGLFFANASHHRNWLREAEALLFERPSWFFDQSPLNAARYRLGLPLKLLDRRFNWLGYGANSLSADLPVVLAHKLVPSRLELNQAYFKGEYELFSPRLVFDQSEFDRLSGRRFALLEEGEIRSTLTLREDGTTLPPTEPDRPGYWFVHEVNGRATLALASESHILAEFIETMGGDWISTRDDGERLIDEANHREPPLTEENAPSEADRFLSQVPAYPVERFHGRGIVICGGGEKYLPPAWVCIHMLRHLGCELPIELWHLRSSEMREEIRAPLERLGVRCVDAAEVRREWPVRFLGGWELKPYAILHSRFEQVLYLDADNVPVLNPTFLFDTREFQSAGAIFWPDYGRLGPDRSIWKICGVPYRDEPEVESGQLMIDKRRCWKALSLALYMNQHSDFYYRHIHGDKETFHMAWQMTGLDYAMIPHAIHRLPMTMCQHDFAGRRIFQHRNFDKWKLGGRNARVEGFLHEELCRRYLEELRRYLEPNRRPTQVGIV